MYNSSMRPPIFQSLSDNVIGSVTAQRPKQSSKTFHWPHEPKNDEKQVDKSHLSREELAAMFQVVMAEQRELHRARQQRYRKKFNAKAYHLQEAVDQLREEIKQLSLRRQSIYTSIPTEMRPWKLVIEYFRVVRNGFKQETGQKTFLQRTMVPHVSFNGGYGIDAVLEDWRMVSLHHEEMEIQLAVVKPDSENSLIAWGDYSIGGHAKAVSSSPGGQFTLGFARRETATGDTQCCEVTRWIVHFKADMLIPLMKLLDNLQDAYRSACTKEKAL